jgi:hypothetical protein
MSDGGKVVATGRRYAIGWYDDWYVIWNVSEPGKPVAYEEGRNPGGWRILAERFLSLENIDLTRFDASGGTAYESTKRTSTVTFPVSGSGGPIFTKLKAHDPNSSATAGGALGIIGAFLSLIPIAGIWFGLLFGVLAIVFSGIGLNRADRVGTGKGIAVTGLVLGIVTIFFKMIPGVNLL